MRLAEAVADGDTQQAPETLVHTFERESRHDEVRYRVADGRVP